MEKLGTAYRRISLISLSLEKNESGDEIQEFQKMAHTFFPNTNVELSFQDEQPKTCDILLTGLHEEDFMSKKYKSFLNQHSTIYILYPGGKIYRQNSDLEDQKIEIRYNLEESPPFAHSENCTETT